MEEESMWKQFYERIKEQEEDKKIGEIDTRTWLKKRRQCACENAKDQVQKIRTMSEIVDRIQELDGGFFEKFGSLLKEQNEQHELEEAKEVVEETPVEAEESEPEDLDEGSLLFVTGWNIEELYSEMLYKILHMVGCDTDTDEQESLFSYLQEAFKLDEEKHQTLLEQARSKEAPNIVLNVNVIEAKGLAPKDANGLSDPFCTLFLNSANTHRYNTSVKAETLSPVWEEHFSLPVDNPTDDILHIEVWDFDPAETVREKMMKLGEVKGVKGLRKLMKEIAVTASTGKHDNELVGTTQLHLRNIPATGQLLWCNIERKNKKQGAVKLELSFSSEKNSQVSMQEHRHLLRLILLHELETSKAEPYQWKGTFPSQAETVLTQHRVQSGLKSVDIDLAQWIEFTNIHVDHHLSFVLFTTILSKLLPPLQSNELTEEEVKLFWEATKKLLPSCMNGIRKIRKLTANEKHTIKEISAVVMILSQLQNLELPNGVDLFPRSVYGWFPENETNFDVAGATLLAINQGAEDWYQHLLENYNKSEPSVEYRLNHLIKVVQFVRTDLQKATEYYDKIFQSYLHIPYGKLLYKLYEKKVSELVEPVITEMCESLKPLRIREDIKFDDNSLESDSLTMGTKLFELYLILQRFSVLGIGLCPGETEELQISNFHLWFHRGIAQWLDIALFKALQRIQKAVELDQLTPVDNSVKYSSSAVDTLAIFYQIKIFWKQLAWPDVEGSYSFVTKIIDDICRCSVYYADQMSSRVEGLGETQNVYEKKFEVTNEWCLSINNIDYVRQSIEPFVKELGMEDIIASLANYRSQAAADHCAQTLQLVIDNAVEVVGNKIIELLETVANKMSPAIKRFLLEGAELLDQDNFTVDKLMVYLDENLRMLYCELNEDNFERILDIIWEDLSLMLFDLVENNLEKRRPPTFFANLHKTLHILVGFFTPDEQQQIEVSEKRRPRRDSPILAKIETLLQIHGMETAELIHQYHLERLSEQTAMEGPLFGLLTIRAQFVEDLLRVEIMNGRNLHPMDNNGSCDSYVKIHLLPEEKFCGVHKPKTKVHKKNLFPLYDESFDIHLSPQQQDQRGGILLFVVKDHDFLGTNDFIGETYMLFADIPKTDLTVGLEQLPQVHLKLNRPTNHDSLIFKALEHRQGDKLAKDFVKKQKAKFSV